MSESECEETIEAVLVKFAESEERVRFFGPGMVIIAEGTVSWVGDGVVGIKTQSAKEANEFVVLDCVVKVQVLGEYRHY